MGSVSDIACHVSVDAGRMEATYSSWLEFQQQRDMAPCDVSVVDCRQHMQQFELLFGCAWLQDLFLGVDGLSQLQWHPYSTVGGPRPHTLVAHIKSYGAWTSGLMRRLLRDGSVTMRIDGPYGEFEERPEWTRHRTLVLIAGGIGVCSPHMTTNDNQMTKPWILCPVLLYHLCLPPGSS